MASHPEVIRVFDVRGLPAVCPPEIDESIDALVCRSVAPGRWGDVYFVLRRGSFVDPSLVVGKGTSHGSPWAQDRLVPLLVRAPGLVPAPRRLGDLSFRAFARALAALLGVDPPPAAAAGEVIFP